MEAEELTKLIKNKWEQYSKLGKPKQFKSHYWTPELDQSDAKCAEASRHKGTEEEKENLRILWAAHKKAERRAKSAWWHDLISNMTETKELAKH